MIINKTISFGDKIFTRVTRNGKTIYNFVYENVENMTDLVSRLRKAMKNIQGLVMLHIRNYNRGWGEERPLMLYPSKAATYNSYQETHPADSYSAGMRQMLFPWETH